MDESQPIELAEAVLMLRAAVDALQSADASRASATELVAELVAIETERRRLEAVDQRLLAQVEEQPLAGEYCCYSVADLLVNLLRVSPTEAKARVDRSRDLGPRRAFTGEPLEPILPGAAVAVAAGEISSGHVAVISDCLDRVPPEVSVEASPVIEQMLIEAARHEHPRQLAKTAALLLLRLDPDGKEPDYKDQQRSFSLCKHADGSSTPTGRWGPEVTAMWEAILDRLAAPVPADTGMPDDRSPTQRRHDAMGEAAKRLLRSGELSPVGGAPVTILATTTIEDLQSGQGVARTGHGDQISISRLLAMSGDAAILPIICDQAGGLVAFGRGRRLASPGQRLALAARDGGCSFPGCDRPAAWCEVHHVRAWIAGGPTDLDNMCLLCAYHHREFERRGWDVVMLAGVPHWRPPRFLDPDRRPVRNTAHHLREFEFRVPAA
jgi:hypothetical protein